MHIDNNLAMEGIAKYKVAAYLRLSAEDGDKEVSDSIVSQKSIIENKLKELGNDFELIDYYIDDGYTGLNTNRPSFQRMIKDIEKFKVNTVITKDLSRLSRNSFEANYYIELYFLERNIRYISILDNVDTAVVSSNNDMIQFKTLINDWYSKDISRKVKSSVWARKEKGLYLAARAPYGYNKSKDDKNHLIINEEQAKIVKSIFLRYSMGESASSIAQSLKDDKVLAPSSYDNCGIFRKEIYNWENTIPKILKNRVYLGHTEFGKRINLSYKSEKVKYMPRDEWRIARNTHEPIIDKDLFENVQRRLELKKKTKKKKFEWMLNGLVFCKECNSKMILKVEYDKSKNIKSKRIHCVEGVRKDSKLFCERKSKAIDEETLNKVVLKNVQNKINKIICEDRIEELVLAQYNENDTKIFDETIKNYEKQLEKVEKNILSLYEDYKNEIIEEDDYKKFYKTELERRNNIKNNITRIKDEKENRPKLSRNQIESLVKELSNIDIWSKDTLSEIIYSIEVDIDNNVCINYRYNIFEMV